MGSMEGKSPVEHPVYLSSTDGFFLFDFQTIGNQNLINPKPPNNPFKGTVLTEFEWAETTLWGVAHAILPETEFALLEKSTLVDSDLSDVEDEDMGSDHMGAGASNGASSPRHTTEKFEYTGLRYTQRIFDD